jgi:hypothetical protein
MGRDDFRSALGGEGDYFGLTTFLGWLPPDLLDEIAREAQVDEVAEAIAAAASAMEVDAAFVPAAGAHAGETVELLHTADIGAIWAVDGVFARVAETLGWAETLRMTAADPGGLAARLDEALHESLVAVRLAAEVDADAVLVADDLSSETGPLLSPDYVLDALMPCYHRLALEVVAEGLPVIFHSDGEIRLWLPALSRAGFSGVHLAPRDAEAFLASAGSARREGLKVLGGVVARSLAAGARAAGEHAGATAASLGGIIVGDDGGLSSLAQFTALGAALEGARSVFRSARE